MFDMYEVSYFLSEAYAHISSKRIGLLSKRIIGMKTIGLVFLLMFLVLNNHAFSQHYYASDGSGEIELFSDSTYVISFYGNINLVFCDTGYYQYDNNTIKLTSKKCSWAEFVEEFDTSNCKPVNDCLFVMRRYKNYSGQQWVPIDERIISKAYPEGDHYVLYLGRDSWYPRDIIIIYDNNYAWRRCEIGKTITYGDLYVKLYPSYREKPCVYLNQFRLKKMWNRLVPCKGTQQYDCWVVNGFYFPTMKRRERPLQKMFVGYRGQYGIERK